MRVNEAAEEWRQRTVLDVRDDYEWRAGRIPGALHIPLDGLAGALGRVSQDRAVLTVCRSGSRSAVAAQVLKRNGYQVENLDGGLQAWARAGLPLESDEATPRIA